MKKIFMSMLLSFSLLQLSACGSVPVAEQPEVSVRDIGLKSLSLTQGTALVALNVRNPNRFPMPIQGVSYGLTINGINIANGAQDSGLSLQAGESSVIQLPITIPFAAASQLLSSAMTQKQLDYTLSGTLKLPLLSIPFSKSGAFSPAN